MIWMFIYVCNSFMTFTTELFYEPANISVYPVSRIRLQTNCTNPSRNHWLSICWIKRINEMKWIILCTAVLQSQYYNFNVRVSDEYASSGNTAILHCTINPDYVRGFVRVLSWTENGKLINSGEILGSMFSCVCRRWSRFAETRLIAFLPISVNFFIQWFELNPVSQSFNRFDVSVQTTVTASWRPGTFTSGMWANEMDWVSSDVKQRTQSQTSTNRAIQHALLLLVRSIA